jgi:hypothetical protein
MTKLSKKRLQKLSGILTEASTLKEGIGLEEIEAQAEHLKGEFLPPSFWNQVIQDIKDMMSGKDADGVRQKYYQGWEDQDFAHLYKLLGSPEMVKLGDSTPRTWGHNTEELEEQAEELDIEARLEEPDIPTEIVDGIMVVNWGDILDVIMPNYWSDFQKHLDTKGKHGYPSYNETSEAVGRWADEHDGIVHSWGGERWLSGAETNAAVRHAKEQGKRLVVMEYLS